MPERIENKQNNFLMGAFVLVVANALVKVIGAVFKIPLTNLFGKEGMGIFTVAYNIYTALFIISTAGLPVAISKMVAEASALGRKNEVRKILSVAFRVFAIVGAAASLIMFFGAHVFTGIVKNSMAYYAVLAISPALLFTAIMSTIRGYYQGLSNMVPTALSQVIEALCKLIFGYGLAAFLLKAGYSIEIAAAGAIGGVTIGTAFGALYLCLKRLRDRKKLDVQGTDPTTRSSREILSNLWKIALPVTVGASVLSITNLVDMLVVMNRLQDIGMTEEAANALYGAYSMSVTMFNLPQTLITAISISIIPAVATAFAKKDLVGAGKTMGSALKLTSIMALPAGAGLTILAGPILNLIYYRRPEDAAIAAPMLRTLGFAVIFVAFVSVTNAVLQSMGKVNVPVVTMLTGGAVKLLTNYTLVGTKSINIHGAPIGTLCCYATITILNLVIIHRSFSHAPNIFTIIARPILAALGMSAVTYIVFRFLNGPLGSKMAVLVTIGAAVVSYAVFLVLFKAITREDALLLPKGEKIAKVLKLQ